MKKRISFGFLILVSACAAIFFGITNKAYPVATVNDGFVSARSFQLAATAAQRYYERVSGMYSELASTTPDEFISRMRQIALQALIEDALITAELQTLYDADALEVAITQRVHNALASSSQSTNEAISDLFGLTVEEFSEVVLAPRARVELLSSELARRSDTIENWVGGALADARVSISVTDLTWKDGQVELTGEQSYTAKVKEIFQQVASTTSQLVASSTVSSSSMEE